MDKPPSKQTYAPILRPPQGELSRYAEDRKRPPQSSEDALEQTRRILAGRSPADMEWDRTMELIKAHHKAKFGPAEVNEQKLRG